MSISRQQMTVNLTQREFQLLDLLEQNKGMVLSRDLLLERIWGIDSEVTTKIVDATVKLLRKKLAAFEAQDMIESIRSVGYKLND